MEMLEKKKGVKRNIHFKPELRVKLETDWKPLRIFSRKRRMGRVDDWFEAFGKKYVITNVAPDRVHSFALPVELEEEEIRSRVHREVSEHEMGRIKPVVSAWGTAVAPLIGMVSPSSESYEDIRKVLKERLGKISGSSFEEKYRVVMEVAYSYSPSEWYDTVMFSNLVFEASRGNKTAANLCGMLFEGCAPQTLEIVSKP